MKSKTSVVLMLAVGLILMTLNIPVSESTSCINDPEPDLECDGNLYFDDIKPGSTVEDSFFVKNVGDPGSELDWEITDYPDWAVNCMFNPCDGDDLKPEDGPVTVEVSFTAPDDCYTEFTGEIKVVNSENSSDYDIVEIGLITSRNMYSVGHLFSQFLERFFECFPILERLFYFLSLETIYKIK